MEVVTGVAGRGGGWRTRLNAASIVKRACLDQYPLPRRAFTAKFLLFQATLREIAAALNGRGIATARGGKWEAATVANVLKRIAGAQKVAA